MPQSADSLLADSTLSDSARTALADSLRTAADSLAPEDTSAISRLNEGIAETGRLIKEGRFEEVVSRGTGALTDFVLEQLIPALLVFAVFYAVYRVLRRVVSGAIRRSRRLDAGIQSLIERAFRLAALSLIAILVLGQLGIDVTALVAGLGIAGIALGFAARDTLENFISGITILLDQPFRVGDNVVVDDVFGTVDEITLRSTRIRTLNGETAIFPNVSMIQSKLVNHTKQNTLRVVIPFGIAYKEFPQQAREVVLALTQSDERLHPDYPPSVVVTAMNESSVDMELRIWLKDAKLEVPVRFEYLERVREALREADIEIPFPHRQLFLDEAKGLEGLLPPGGEA